MDHPAPINLHDKDYTYEEKLIVATWVHDRYLTSKSFDDIQKDFEARFNKQPPNDELMMMWENNAFATGSVDRQPNNYVCSTCQKNNKGREATQMEESHLNPMNRTNFYKTEICNKFERYGRCEFGDACTFAHGIHELKPIPGYKTRLCANFTLRGFCEFGSKCIFLHERQNDIFKSRRINRAKYNAERFERSRSYCTNKSSNYYRI